MSIDIVLQNLISNEYYAIANKIYNYIGQHVIVQHTNFIQFKNGCTTSLTQTIYFFIVE